jgi:hypothetical protein
MVLGYIVYLITMEIPVGYPKILATITSVIVSTFVIFASRNISPTEIKFLTKAAFQKTK